MPSNAQGILLVVLREPSVMSRDESRSCARQVPYILSYYLSDPTNSDLNLFCEDWDGEIVSELRR